MKRPYRHIPYRTGLATEVSVGGIEFTLIAPTPEKLLAAFAKVTGGLLAFDSSLSQSVKICRNNEKKP